MECKYKIEDEWNGLDSDGMPVCRVKRNFRE